MMTIHRVSAGDGYEYYTQEVASADERRERKQEFGDYYLQSGAPAGVWMGNEISRHFGISGEVTEQQMRDLFGQGKRPDAQVIRDEKDGVVDERELLLGNPYAVYPEFHQEFTDAVREAIDDFRSDNDGAEPSARRLAQFRRQIAHDMFVADRHREPADAAELTRFLTTQVSTSTQAVAGFDLTFSVPKSVSVMWALGDTDLRSRVERAHTRAIEETLTWLEAEVIGSRAGRNGVRRVSVDGVMAARFRHYDSRAGDPQLHDHLLVSNKVFIPFGRKNEDGTPAGVWRTIDSKALYKAVVASSTRYDNALMSHLTNDLGVTFEQRGGDDCATKMEISDVPETLVEQFSTRRTSIKGRLAELVDRYTQLHGSRPGRVATMRLAQQATLETRRPKEHVPLPDRIRQWRSASPVRYTAGALDDAKRTREAEALREPSARQRLAALLHLRPPAAPGRPELGPVSDAELARRVLAALEERRSTWTLRHVQAEAARQLAVATAGADCDGDRITLLTTRVLNDPDMILLSTPEPVLHQARADKNGKSVYDHPDMWRYTSPGVVTRETRLLDVAEQVLVPPVTEAVVSRVLADADSRGAPLGADQSRMVRALATSPRAVVTAVGPAGAGKTTAMRAMARAVAEQGATLVGLAPSAVAARELGDSLDVEAMTVQRWLTKEAWTTLKAGDVVLIDEAGMVGNNALTAITERAVSAGAAVRMVGDPAQLGAVDASGAFDLLHRTSPDPVELDQVWRFKDPAEADASLELRSGPAAEAFTWYEAHDRVRGGGEQEILTEAHAAWTADHEAGLTTLIVASTTERVATLNDQIASARAATGETLPAPDQVTTRDGHLLRIGDTVLTRRNDPRNRYGSGNFVRNGDLFTIAATHADGSLTVQAPDQSVIDLDADYVAGHVQLGYAATVHRAQGATVDTAHAVLDASVDRSLAYVALTRGRQRNTAWLVVEDDQPVSAVLTAIAERTGDDPSAIAAAAEEARAAGDPVRMRDIYTDLNATVDRIRWSNRLDELAQSDRIPLEATRALDSTEFKEVVSHLNSLEAAGIDVDTLLSDLCQNMGRPQDPAGLLAWRLEDWRAQHPTITDPDHEGPMSAMDDDALADTRRQAEAQAVDAARRLTARDLSLTDTDGQPAWGNRPHGRLTDAQLADAIRDTVAESFAHAVDDPTGRGPDKALDDEALALIAERDTRATMDTTRRRGENIQRWALSHVGDLTRPETTMEADVQVLTASAEKSYDAARTLIDEAVEETLRRRWRLSGSSPASPSSDGDGLTQWTAPDAALADPRTPDKWRAALAGQRGRLTQAIDDAGSRALDQADWAQGLTRPADMSQDQWRRAVGEVFTYRATNRVGDHLPLEETARTGDDAETDMRSLVSRLAQSAHQGTSPADEALNQAERALTAERRRAATDDALQAARRALSERVRTGQSRSAQPQRASAARPAPRGPHL